MIHNYMSHDKKLIPRILFSTTEDPKQHFFQMGLRIPWALKRFHGYPMIGLKCCQCLCKWLVEIRYNTKIDKSLIKFCY